MMARAILLGMLVFFMLNADGTSYSLPGKPTLIRCRSPEKETFTCWWQPSSDGGLPTNYALYYRKENSDTVYECPDYHTAGENSCFFNKNDTSIWVNYNITVVATNALGSTFSEPVDIDVMYIVKPNSPEMVAVTVGWEDKEWPFLRVSWEPPQKADTRSGWITLIYEIRIKLEEEDEWETHLAGQQKVFNIFSLRSGGTYHVQVRCKPDHGFWSEWSSTSSAKVPIYVHREKSVWILISVFSALIFLILTWLIHMNSHELKHCILPPVPGPKIKGFDKQLLKNGKSDDTFSSLVVSDFPPTTMSNYEDLLVEYLDVYIPEEQELILEENKDLQDNCLKSENSTFDSDSGRGSCDSHTLLMDKSGEAKEEDSQIEMDTKGPDEAHEDDVSPDMSSGRVKTWPSVFSPLPQYSSSSSNQPSSLEMAKQHSLSDNLFPPNSLSSGHAQPGQGTREGLGSNYWEFSFSNKQLHQLRPHPAALQQPQAHSDINVSTISHKGGCDNLPQCVLQPSEYVEVQRMNEQNMVVLHPVPSGCGKGCTDMHLAEDYSKVKGVDSDNVLLLLQGDAVKKEATFCQYESQQGSAEAVTSTTPQKPAACTHSVLPGLDERAVSGYIDTTTMFTLPTY